VKENMEALNRVYVVYNQRGCLLGVYATFSEALDKVEIFTQNNRASGNSQFRHFVETYILKAKEKTHE